MNSNDTTAWPKELSAMGITKEMIGTFGAKVEENIGEQNFRVFSEMRKKILFITIKNILNYYKCLIEMG